MIITDKPPNGFSTGGMYTSCLRIYRWEDPENSKRVYWIYDARGFLCSVSTLTEVDEFLSAEARRPPEPFSRPRYWPKARDLAFPGTAEEIERKALEVDAGVTAMVNSTSYRAANPRLREAPKAKLSLSDIGL